MKLIRKSLLGGLLALIGWVSLGAGSMADAASTQAGSIRFIDDEPDNLACPNATITANLSTVIPTSGQTITLCPGEYTGPLIISGVTNVRLTGKANDMEGAPRIVPQRDARVALISIVNSSNVTVSGLTLDGAPRNRRFVNWAIDAADPSGIHVVNSSVTISSNYVLRMRRPEPDMTTVGFGIRVDGASTMPQQIKILNNTIFDFHSSGIAVYSMRANYQPTITRNVISTPVTGSLPPLISGITLRETSTGSVSSNTISAAWHYMTLGNCCSGIDLLSTQRIKVTANKISGVTTGISAGAFDVEHDFVSNTISGNTLLNAGNGISVGAGSNQPGSLSVNGNKITGNKVTSYSQLTAGSGIQIYASNINASASFSNNTISGNTILGYGSNAIVNQTQDHDPAHIKITDNKVGYPVPGK